MLRLDARISILDMDPLQICVDDPLTGEGTLTVELLFDMELAVEDMFSGVGELGIKLPCGLLLEPDIVEAIFDGLAAEEVD